MTVKTPFTPDEAQLIARIFGQIQVNAADPGAVDISQKTQSILAKCETIIRVNEPMASAAKSEPEKKAARAGAKK